MDERIDITLNGEAKRVASGTVLDLLATLGLNPAKVAVERNRLIAPRSSHAETALAAGDEIEIVHFVGGG